MNRLYTGNQGWKPKVRDECKMKVMFGFIMTERTEKKGKW